MHSRIPSILILCAIVLMSLACFSAAETLTAYPASTPMPATEDTTMLPADAALAAGALPSKTQMPACAVVVADEALHLRVDPDPNSRILAFMENGDVVKLISITIDDWWLIKRGDQLGYARSKYLSRVECR